MITWRDVCPIRAVMHISKLVTTCGGVFSVMGCCFFGYRDGLLFFRIWIYNVLEGRVCKTVSGVCV